MKYYIKKLGSQELGSVRNGKAQRGRYVYVSKDEAVLDFFPQLSTTVTNDSSLVAIVPLYQDSPKKIYCNFIYHNDKFTLQDGTRNEYRLYSNKALEENKLLFEAGDILIFRNEVSSRVNNSFAFSDSVNEIDSINGNVTFLYLCADRNTELYQKCDALVQTSNIRGKGHAIYEGIFDLVENKISNVMSGVNGQFDTVIEDTVTAKAQSGDIDAMANLFNSVSFRDFVMTGYENKCAITGTVIRYGAFMNLEAAHIWPKSHKGKYLPSNGIAMCRDMHWAFDKGLFTINDDFTIKVHPDVSSDYLGQYDKKKIFIPQNQFFIPDVNNLHYHQDNIFGLFKSSGSLIKARGYLGSRMGYPVSKVAEKTIPYGKQ